MKRLVIIGAGGQLGYEFQRALSRPENRDAFQAIFLNHRAIDVADYRSVLGALTISKPFDAVVNLAAFHNVDECEAKASVAYSVNTGGAANVAKACQKFGAKAVYLSTDYVFDGASRVVPYKEHDIPNPLNVYGQSKAFGEHATTLYAENHLIVRTSSLFGVRTSRKGHTFPEMVIHKARQGGKLRVVSDQWMCPTYGYDLARKVLEMIGRDVTGIVHAAGTGFTTWYDFARTTLAEARIEATVEPTKYEDMKKLARRPLYSCLGSYRLRALGIDPLPSWEDGMKRFLVDKGVEGTR